MWMCVRVLEIKKTKATGRPVVSNSGPFAFFLPFFGIYLSLSCWCPAVVVFVLTPLHNVSTATVSVFQFQLETDETMFCRGPLGSTGEMAKHARRAERSIVHDALACTRLGMGRS
jgi:hypothetical protein